MVDTDIELILLYRQDFIQLENETVFNEAVIEEREQGIREIHVQIGEVNEIFKDLAVLVHEQGYMIGKWHLRQHPSILFHIVHSYGLSFILRFGIPDKPWWITSSFVGTDDIDSNVQGAEAATEQANRQLVKAAKSQKSGTTLVIIVLLTDNFIVNIFLRL
jgi:syntaxin 7